MPAFVEFAAVSKTYPRAGAPALDGIDLAIPEGCLFGLLGPNGAGKTTLLAVLLGLVSKDAGAVRVSGRSIDDDLHGVRQICGLAPQDLGFYPMLTVAENLRFYAAVGGQDRAAARAHVAFAIATTRLEDHLDKRAAELSGGLKRRLNLALSLLGSPRLLLLDEPTVGVDPQSRAFLLDAIRKLRDERGLTVIYTSHYMDEVQQLCDRVAIMDGGRVLREGALAELLARHRNLEELFLELTRRSLRD